MLRKTLICITYLGLQCLTAASVVLRWCGSKTAEYLWSLQSTFDGKTIQNITKLYSNLHSTSLNSNGSEERSTQCSSLEIVWPTVCLVFCKWLFMRHTCRNNCRMAWSVHIASFDATCACQTWCANHVGKTDRLSRRQGVVSCFLCLPPATAAATSPQYDGRPQQCSKADWFC